MSKRTRDLTYDEYDALLQGGYRRFEPLPPDFSPEPTFGQWGRGTYVLDDGSELVVVRSTSEATARAVHRPVQGRAYAALLTESLDEAHVLALDAARLLAQARERAATVSMRTSDGRELVRADALFNSVQAALDALAVRV